MDRRTYTQISSVFYRTSFPLGPLPKKMTLLRRDLLAQNVSRTRIRMLAFACMKLRHVSRFENEFDEKRSRLLSLFRFPPITVDGASVCKTWHRKMRISTKFRRRGVHPRHPREIGVIILPRGVKMTPERIRRRI